ncbi:Uncharacterized protein dnm_057090 [Desulfonema magnum]|uniref:Uncharacterized protein n=1 Tax=Desulfonema magnum TaxID=45655 RepID=A0A975GQ96_9BACT|nr:Uncharacterized protein dnm_057090 [Desulfonema magnum]
MVSKYLSKSFLYIFLSPDGGGTRLFPPRTAGPSEKKSRVSQPLGKMYKKFLFSYLVSAEFLFFLDFHGVIW